MIQQTVNIVYYSCTDYATSRNESYGRPNYGLYSSAPEVVILPVLL